MEGKRPRFILLDALRGVGILLMVGYHFLFDWNFLVEPIVDLNEPFWFILARGAAAMFVGLAGGSMVLYAHRRGMGFSSLFKRGLAILGLGMVITLVTWLVFPTYTVWFGVLHLIGSALILGIPFLTQKTGSLVAGLFFLGGGILLSTNPLYGILPPLIGIIPFPFLTFDYFPLFPWFGVFLLGMYASHRLFPRGHPVYPWLGQSHGTPITRLLGWIGRNSLVIYFIHQPLLLGILVGLGKIHLSI
ncbi:MAG: heparan-alpha-glucosaminide N-acetyltransferase [Candidatus Diapherotrites archaeon]|nr:heparan-alpha-glucosaminide N-acetyltransferase [Candidatus Diapherotrites archaeon]MDZ4256088.1 heparan-alpha-glucosaminide N-acetyltransferase [archaeon]